MEKRKSVRAIILKDEGIILIHRIKNDSEYYVFPGGGIENSETYEQCVVREVMEEIGINIKPLKQSYINETEDKIEVFYLCKYIDGVIGTGEGPEFSSSEYSTKGSYSPEIIGINKLSQINLLPTIIRDNLVEDIKNFLT